MELRKNIDYLKQNMGKKVFSCPSCHKKLRVPIKMGKTLAITCPRCTTLFHLRFEHPLQKIAGKFRQTFYWNRALPLKDNLRYIVGNLFTSKKIFSRLIFLGIIVGIYFWYQWYQNLGV